MINKKDLLTLRKATMLGIAKCQAALVKAKGDINQAIQILRKEGAKIAAKRADRAMPEGRIFVQVSPTHNAGAMIGIGCETDFVAQTQGMETLGKAMAKAMLEHPCIKKDLLALPYQKSTFGEELTQLAGRSGEHVALIQCVYIEGPTVGYYIHTGSKLGAMVALNKASTIHQDLTKPARDVAMQVVVSDPITIDKHSIDPAVLAGEKEVITSQLKKSTKTSQMLDKIIQGKLAKFIQENTLLEQPFIKDESMTIAMYLKTVIPDLMIKDFQRVQVGG